MDISLDSSVVEHLSSDAMFNGCRPGYFSCRSSVVQLWSSRLVMQWSVDIGLNSSIVEHLTSDAVICIYRHVLFFCKVPD